MLLLIISVYKPCGLLSFVSTNNPVACSAQSRLIFRTSVALCTGGYAYILPSENIETAAIWGNSVWRSFPIRLFLRDVAKQKIIDIPRFLSVLHSDLLNKV